MTALGEHKLPVGGGAAVPAAVGSAASPDQASAGDDGPVRRKRPAEAAVGMRPRGRPRKVRVEAAVEEPVAPTAETQQATDEHENASKAAVEGEGASLATSTVAVSDAGGDGGDEATGAQEEAADAEQQQNEHHEQPEAAEEPAPVASEQADAAVAQETRAAPPLASESSSSAPQKAADPAPQVSKSHRPPKSPKARKTRRARISAASARSLFQFTCKTLQSQRLEYEVRARELDEKTAQLAAERDRWEKKLRRVKRRLRDFGHPVDALEPDGGGTDAYALTTAADWSAAPSAWPSAATRAAGSDTSLVTMRDALSGRASGFSGAGVGGITDAHIPVSIQHLEAQIRDALRARKRLVLDKMRDLQGLSDRSARPPRK